MVTESAEGQRRIFARKNSNELLDFKKKLDERHSERKKDAQKQGEIQGSQNLPPVDDPNPHPYQNVSLKGAYQGDLADIRLELGQTLESIFADLIHQERRLNRSPKEWRSEAEEATRALEETTDQEKATAEKAYAEKMALINDTLDNEITGPFNLVKTKLDQVQQRLGRNHLDTWLTNSVVYYFFLGLIGLSEFPLNSLVFADLGLTITETLLISGTLVIGIPLTAHFGGIGLKRRGEEDNGKLNLWIFLLCTSGILALSYFIGEQREVYLFRVMPDGTAPAAIDTSKFIMVSLSILLYGLGLLLSYGHHDTSQEMQDAVGEFNKAKAIYDKRYGPAKKESDDLKRRHTERMAQIDDAHTKKLRAIQARKASCEQMITDLRATYDSELGILKALESSVCANYRIAVGAYQEANLQRRRNHATPISYSRELPPLERHFAEYAELDRNPRIGNAADTSHG